MTRQTATAETATAETAIERYRPTKFTETEWAVAGPVVRAAVARSRPTSAASARKLLGALAAFLLWTSDWDRAKTPELSEILTADALDSAKDDESWGSQSTRHDRVRSLACVAVAIGAVALELPGHGSVALALPAGVDTQRFERNEVGAKRDDAADVATAVSAYEPQRMALPEWQLAASAAAALATATRPATAKTARQLMGAIAAFLTTTAEWDRSTAPDLAALLTLEAINAHLSRATFKSTKTRDKRRTQLLQLARAAGSVPTASSLPATPRAVDIVLAAGAVRPIPVATLAGVKQARSRTSDSGMDHLAQCIARARDADGTDPRIQVSSTLSLSMLATGLTITPLDPSARTEEEAMAQDASGTPAPAPATPVTKTSRRAAGAAAMAAHKRANEAAADRLDGGASRLPDASELDEAIRHALDQYLPKAKNPNRRAAWRVNRDLAIQLVTAYKPASLRNATNIASFLATYLEWAATANGREVSTPMSVDALLHAEQIEPFLEASTWADASKSSARSVLRRIDTNLRPHGSSTRFTAAPPGAPYSRAERLQFIRLAQHQPTPLQQRRLSFIVGLGLGAGIDSHDFRHLAAGHFERTQVGGRQVLLVHIPGRGARARTVAVSEELAPMVLGALDSHYSAGETDDALVVASCPDAINIATPTTRRIRSADDASHHVTTARLRNTWLVAAMCAPIPMADLMQFAGVRTAGTLTGLLGHCPPPSPEHVAAIHAELVAITGADQ